MLPLSEKKIKISTLWQQQSVTLIVISVDSKHCVQHETKSTNRVATFGDQMFPQSSKVKKKKLQSCLNTEATLQVPRNPPCCHRLSRTCCLTGATTVENFAEHWTREWDSENVNRFQEEEDATKVSTSSRNHGGLCACDSMHQVERQRVPPQAPGLSEWESKMLNC